jgi:hypothetical protein
MERHPRREAVQLSHHKHDGNADEMNDAAARTDSREELLRRHYDEYRAMLGDEVSDERAREIIESLWLTTGHFVDLG